MQKEKKKKIFYAYVDESGQDDKSAYFTVVAVLTDDNRERIRKELVRIEDSVGTKKRKWHKLRHEHRMKYLRTVLNENLAGGGIYIGSYKKPVPFFFPMLEVLREAIKHFSRGEKCQVQVTVDGIDRHKARQLTNALRGSKIHLQLELVTQLVHGRRDESEPLIRLADMWAGCIRGALLKYKDSMTFLEKAKRAGYLNDLTN